MQNPYKKHLYNFFHKSNYFIHISFRFENLINKEFKNIGSKESDFYSSNALVIADWTGETDNGWDFPFHTDVFTTTDNENYKNEMDKMKSRQNLINFAQSFEAFQGFLKDVITEKNEKITRIDLKYNNKILQNLKEEGGKSLFDFSNSNNRNFNFEILFNMLVELRHSITHSNGIIEKNKIIKDSYSEVLFKLLFPDSDIEKNNIILAMTYKAFSKIMKTLNEFAFQIYKIFSVECKFNYVIN